MFSDAAKRWEEIPANHCYYERLKTQRDFYINLPSKGAYKLELYSKESRGLMDSENSSELYDLTLSYKISCTGGTALSTEDVKKLKPPYPESFTKFQRVGHQLFEPKSGNLKVNEAVLFKLSASGATKMSVVIKGAEKKETWIPLTKDKDEIFQGKVTPTTIGKATVFALYPTSQKDRYLALLQYNVV